MRTLLLLFFTLNFLNAQKVVEKSIVHSAISSFQIDASNCFQINLSTSDSAELVVEATIEGEYRKDLVLNLNEEGSTVLVSAGFRSNFENPNDKLSAHKVVSIALEIKLPAFRNVNIFGTNSNIKTKGVYEKLKITSNDGFIRLIEVEGSAEVTTQSGDIIVESKSAKILSKSKYGKVDENQIPVGDNKYLLNTVTGNIRFKRIE